MPKFDQYPHVLPQWQDEILIKDVSVGQTARCTLEEVYELFGWTTTTTTTTSSSTTTSTSSSSTTTSSSTSSSSSTTTSTSTSTSSSTSTTASCDYNEFFPDGEKWLEEYLNNTAYQFSGDAVSFIDQAVSGGAQLLYKWSVPTTAFDVRIDLTHHDGANINAFFVLCDSFMSTTDRFFLRVRNDGSWKVAARATINGAAQPLQEVVSTCDKLRFTRSGTTFKAYYHKNNQWFLLDTQDFGAFANNLRGVRLRGDGAGAGGSATATFDNLVFWGGCPDGTYFWTSTTTTSTSSSSSSTSTSSSTASTQSSSSTQSSTSSSSSTVSTQSSTSTTTSTFTSSSSSSSTTTTSPP